jgi:hypothetical protein
VIFALSLVALLTAAGLAIDISRFHGERRFLQNAADAAALAAANALIRGESSASAEAEARDVLTRNFLSGMNGSPALPATVPVYESGFAGDPEHLVDGILIGSGEVRVAVRHDVGYTFGRLAGLDTSRIGAQARAVWQGRLLPIAVPRYRNPAGPYTGVAPCPLLIDLSAFLDIFSTALTACLGDLLNVVFRLLPQPGAAWDPVNPNNDTINHGPTVPILGNGANPPNNADFRGFVALDVRNFAVAGSQLYYNGLTSGSSTASVSTKQAGWIYAKGYPGPDFPAVITPPDPNDQVMILGGTSTDEALTAMNATFVPGDEILVTVYEGNVLAANDFAITAPAYISLPGTGLTVNAGLIRVSRSPSFGATVTMSTVADTRDAQSPMMLGTLLGVDPLLYIPNPVTPTVGKGTQVLTNQLLTLGATPGIFNVWYKGVGGGLTRFVPVALKIGVVTRDFLVASDVQARTATNVGDSVSFQLSLTNRPSTQAFGGPVNLSVDPALANGIGSPTRTGIGAITFGSTSVTPTAAGATTTLTINTGTLAPGTYDMVVRATGMNGDLIPRKVTHLLPIQVHVATTPPAKFVDIAGFAVMRIVAVDPDFVTAQAIAGPYADMNDPRLVRGRTGRLTPW